MERDSNYTLDNTGDFLIKVICALDGATSLKTIVSIASYFI